MGNDELLAVCSWGRIRDGSGILLYNKSTGALLKWVRIERTEYLLLSNDRIIVGVQPEGTGKAAIYGDYIVVGEHYTVCVNNKHTGVNIGCLREGVYRTYYVSVHDNLAYFTSQGKNDNETPAFIAAIDLDKMINDGEEDWDDLIEHKFTNWVFGTRGRVDDREATRSHSMKFWNNKIFFTGDGQINNPILEFEQ